MRGDGGNASSRASLIVAATAGMKKREMERILAAKRTGIEDAVFRMISWQRTHVLDSSSPYFFSTGIWEAVTVCD